MSKRDAKAYAKQCEQDRRDEMERKHIREMLDVIGPFRYFLIRSAAPDSLLSRLDDWIEDLTGDRTFFWSTHMNSPTPRILLKHERATTSDLLSLFRSRTDGIGSLNNDTGTE